MAGVGGAAIGEGQGGGDGHEQGYGPILPMSQFAGEGAAQPPTPPSSSGGPGGSGVSTRGSGRGSRVSTRGSGVSTRTATLRLPSLMSLR